MAVINTGTRALVANDTVMTVILSVSFCHLLNDMMQSLLASIYPMIKTDFSLDFVQIGIITLAFQLTASVLQPLVGLYTDHRPQPYSLSVGMGFTMVGLILLAYAGGFSMLLMGAAMVGIGSSIFHPESSRVARLASGGRHGLAQSVFQVGGNFGSAIGPLLAAFIVLPNGRGSVAWFCVAAIAGMIILYRVGNWYRTHATQRLAAGRAAGAGPALPQRTVVISIAILIILTFSKNFYLASFTSYFTFYLIDRFALSVQSAQLHLFMFLGAAALGTVLGGPIGDAIGRKPVIWLSILGVLPFSLALPYVDLFWTNVFVVIIGFVMASAFPAIVVFAQELVPGKVGMIAGLFFGFAFGMGGIGAAVLGYLADVTSIGFVYKVCSGLPALGLLTAFLPNLETARRRAKRIVTAPTGTSTAS